MISRRRTILVCFAAALALLLTLLPLPQATTPAWAAFNEIAVEWSVGDITSVSQEFNQPATAVGLTWTTTAPNAAWYRAKIGAVWGPWEALPLSLDHGPDPNTPEAHRSHPGSDLVWVGEADSVQFRVSGDADRETTAVLIDTTDRTKPLAKQFKDAFGDPTADAATGAPSQPPIHPRADWDPSNSCEPQDTPGEVQVTHTFVHHTAGADDNSYTAAEVPGRVLAICLFHVNTRGWDDIGYNFLIDRYGGIWEGRAGGIEKGIQGAHAAGFNSYSFGVAFIGNHVSTGPTAAAEAALEELIAWKFGVHNVDPTNSSVLVSKGSALWPEGTPVSMKPVSGHRDAQATTCPGEACYQRLPSYRAAIDAEWDQVPLDTYQSPLVGDFDGDGLVEGAVFRITDGVWGVAQTTGSLSAWADFSTGSAWSRQLVGDFDGDNRDDIANYNSVTGKWMVSISTGSAFTTTKWDQFKTKTGWTSLVGDFNGDNRDDIANYHPGTGKWMVSVSTGSAFTTTKWDQFITKTGWTSLVGDFNGDNRDDIANYHTGSGNWIVEESDGGSFTTSIWATFTTKTGWILRTVGDFNGDKRDDIANYHTGSGNWVVSESDGSDFVSEVWGEYETPDHMSYAFSVNADGDPDDELFAIDAYNGFLVSLNRSGSNFGIDTVDTPWRTTWGGTHSRGSAGSTSLAFFGQEFTWIKLEDLGSATPQWSTLVRMSTP